MSQFRGTSVMLVLGIIFGVIVSGFVTAVAWSLAHARFDAVGTSGVVLTVGLLVGFIAGLKLATKLFSSLDSMEQACLSSISTVYLDVLKLARRYPDRNTLIGELERKWSTVNEQLQKHLIAEEP